RRPGNRRTVFRHSSAGPPQRPRTVVPRARLMPTPRLRRAARKHAKPALSQLEFDMLQLRRFAHPSTLALAILLGMQGTAWAQQSPTELAPAELGAPASKAPLPLE